MKTYNLKILNIFFLFSFLFIMGVIKASAAAAHFPVNNSTTNNGFNDNVPRQITRASNDVIYIYGAVVGTGKINMFYNPQGGYPNASSDFSGSTSITNPSAVFVVDGAYDGIKYIHVLVSDMSGTLTDYPFNTQNNTFGKGLIVSSSDATPVSNTDIGTTGISSMFDRSGVLHIAYWGSGNQIIYKSYTFDGNNLSLKSGPQRLDNSGTATHPALAVSPYDQSITVAWVNGLSGNGTISTRIASNGTWGSIQTASNSGVWTSSNSGYNIDQGPSLVIGSDGTKAFTYIENFGSCGSDYGRLHFVTQSVGSNSWNDQRLSNFCTHADGLGVDSSNNYYAISHGHPSNPTCTSLSELCYVQRNSDGTWNNPVVFLTPPSGDSLDDSVSTKWSDVGWNKSETIEFVFFDAIAGSYTNTSLWYGRLSTSGIVPTPTPTPTPTISTSITPFSCTCNNNLCTNTCSFNEESGVTYSSQISCSRESVLGPPQSLSDQNNYCNRFNRTRGDADGNGVVDNTDYFYYVRAVNGALLPSSVNPDFDGNGYVSPTDRSIIIQTLIASNITPTK